MNMTSEMPNSQNTPVEALRIVQFGPTLYHGGVAVAIKQLCLDMARLGQKVMLIGNGGEGMDKLVDAGVDYQELNWSGTRSLLGSAGQVRKRLKAFQPDIVHVHGRGPSLACILAGRKPDCFTMHNTHLTDQVGLLDFGPVRKYFSPLGRQVFALNPEAVKYLTTQLGVKPDCVEIIPNGVDTEYFRPPTDAERATARSQFGVGEQETMALFVGRFHEQKQPETAVELAAAARDAGLKEVRVILVGTGSLEENVREHIRALQVEDICKIHNWMNPLVAYWAADLLLMPSLYEGYGLVAAEALACGCPVLRTKSGGYELMIREGVTGFGCLANRDAFIAKGLEVLRNRDALQNMRPAARAWAQEKLGIRLQTEQMLTAYRRLLSERRAS